MYVVQGNLSARIAAHIRRWAKAVRVALTP
ncbi:hypothetical protein STAN_6086 [Streptomyces sp. CBMAI 2042]|nr:hypothetical protein STAN_6086 [Streptomyces sp. CBMAI 2042]